MWRRPNLSAMIILILSLCLFSSMMYTVFGESSMLWRFSPQSPLTVDVQVIEDVSGDGCQDVFIATSATTRYSDGKIEELPAELILIEGRTKDVICTLTLGQISVKDTLYMNRTVAVSETNMLKVYNISLHEIYNKTFCETPRLLRTFDESKLIFALDRNLTLLELENGEPLWIWCAPSKITNILVTKRRILCAYPEHITMLDANGTFVCSQHVPRPDFSYAIYTESLHRLDDAHFLYLEDVWLPFGKSPNVSLSMWKVDDAAFDMKWKIEVGGRSANKPYMIPDVDSDGVNDFICRRKEDDKIAVFSGKTGDMIYTTSMSAYYIGAACLINDVDGDGIAETALGLYTQDWSHGLYICSFKRNVSVSYRIICLNLYSRLVPIEDVDGDELLDIVGEAGGKVECYRGFDSRIIPEFSTSIFLLIIFTSTLFMIYALKKLSVNVKSNYTIR
jgi:hypothetical protein